MTETILSHPRVNMLVADLYRPNSPFVAEWVLLRTDDAEALRVWQGLYLIKHNKLAMLVELLSKGLSEDEISTLVDYAVYHGLTADIGTGLGALYALQGTAFSLKILYLRTLLHAASGQEATALRLLACYRRLRDMPPLYSEATAGVSTPLTREAPLDKNISIIPGDAEGVYFF